MAQFGARYLLLLLSPFLLKLINSGLRTTVLKVLVDFLTIRTGSSLMLEQIEYTLVVETL